MWLLILHPSVHAEIKYLEKYGPKICEEDITGLIPLCDIFVSGVSSYNIDGQLLVVNQL